MIYLDHNATTPVDERVLAAMLPFLQKFYGNPSSLYRLGRFASTAIDIAREQIAALIGSSSSEVIFTSGGTEANNLALNVVSPGAKLAISAIEHPSVTEPAQRLRAKGRSLSIIAVDNNGLITDEAVAQLLALKPHLASVIMANNETGVVQNIEKLASALTGHNIIIHSDAVQALGKIPIAFNRLGVDLMSVSSHKIHGPKGCGALIVKRGRKINPLFLGGGQEQGLRAGTENVAAIVGFGKAAELAQAEFVKRETHLKSLKQLLEQNLESISELTIFSEQAPRLPNTVQFGIRGIDGEMLVMKLDQKGVCVSSASACASGGHQPSSVLTAMGIDANLAKSALRVSLGHTNTETEIIEFVTLLKSLLNQSSF
jgi:cysteine desulfurase